MVDDDGVLRGLITVKDIFKRREYPNANKDQHGRLRVARRWARRPDDLERARRAGGRRRGRAGGRFGPRPQRRGARDAWTGCGRRSPTSQLVGGNVATEAGARELVGAGSTR